MSKLKQASRSYSKLYLASKSSSNSACAKSTLHRTQIENKTDLCSLLLCNNMHWYVYFLFSMLVLYAREAVVEHKCTGVVSSSAMRGCSAACGCGVLRFRVRRMCTTNNQEKKTHLTTCNTQSLAAVCACVDSRYTARRRSTQCAAQRALANKRVTQG